jgi:hypothetical protein
MLIALGCWKAVHSCQQQQQQLSVLFLAAKHYYSLEEISGSASYSKGWR